MNWITEAPKQDGWYWWRRGEMDPPEVVQLQRGTVMWAGDDVGTMVGGMSGEFLGPLDPAQVLSYEPLVKELHLTRLALDGERERCAKVARAQAKSIRRCNTYRGRVNNDAEQAAIWCEQIAAEIEKSTVTL